MTPPQPLQLNVQQLRTFCAVLDLGSYSAAAREAGLSTSAAWEHVKELERQYAAQLFERKGRQVSPTPAARKLHELLQPILAGLESTREVIAEESGHRPQQITIAAGVRMMIEEISVALRTFQRKHPETRIRLLQSDPLTVESMVARGEADLAYSIEPGPERSNHAVEFTPAYEIDYLLVMPRRHPLVDKQPLELADLLGHALIVPHARTHTRRLLEQALYQHDIWREVNIAVETANSAFTVACVRAGLGLGIIGGRPDGGLCQGLGVRSLAPWLGQARIVCVSKRGATLGAAVKNLAAAICETGQGE